VEAVYEAAQRILSGAREGRPGFIEIDAYRFHGHARMDKSPYRGAEEEMLGRARDPLLAARHRLLSEGLASDPDLDQIDGQAEAEMDAALDQAIAAPSPDQPSLFEDVYAPGTPRPQPQRDRLRRILSEVLP
jgi:pyruvate dehydrogenase E1 component alpha subunit